METVKIIKGKTEHDVWEEVAADLALSDMFAYEVRIDQNRVTVDMSIDIDMGGGFESGYALTRFSAVVNTPDDFRFALHDESFIDGIGKFLGMEDIEIGYAELDKRLIIKTNNAAKVHRLFGDAAVWKTFSQLQDFDLGIHQHTANGVNQRLLQLNIEEGITDVNALRKVYHAFYSVLTGLAK